MQPTPLDVAIVLSLLLNVLGACHRGLGREMLHTVLFTLLAGLGYVMFCSSGTSANPKDIAFWVVNSSYYLMTAYILTWVAMKVLSGFIMGPAPVGFRSRFWAGALCIAKLATVILGLNLWFALHSDKPHPERLEVLPQIMQNSQFIRLSDLQTERLYIWLAAHNVVEYKKNLERAPTQGDLERQRLEKEFGVSPTGI